MPTYAYACTECEHRFEIVQSFVEDSLTDCPQCDGRLRKLFNAVGVVFKGSGFYRTDSRNDMSRGSGGASRNGSSSGLGKDSRAGSDSASSSTSSSKSGSSSSDSSSASTSSDSSSSGGTTKTVSKSEGSKSAATSTSKS